MHYFASGLHLLSNEPLAGLMPQAPSSQVDVRISLGGAIPGLEREKASQERWYASSDLDETGQPVLAIWTVAEGACYRMAYHDGGEFLVDRNGTRVWGIWSDSVSIDERVVCLLGPVLSFVLCLRGIVCLHASVVAVAGRAVAFVGPEGAGKSTIAAAFARGGHAVLADEVAALNVSNEGIRVQPSYPWLRLRPGAVNVLFDKAGDAPRLLPRANGACFDLELTQEGYRFERRALPLAAVYFLMEPADDVVAPQVEAMNGGECMIALVANTWARRVLDPSMRAREFGVLGQLCASLPMRRVRPPSRTQWSPQMSCEAIRRDFEQLEFDSCGIGPVASADSSTLSAAA